MPNEVAWRLMFRVNRAAGADRCLARVLDLVDARVTDPPKAYWKMPELWECSLVSPCDGPPGEAVLSLLMTADRLATGWHVTGPTIVDGAVASFDGVFSNSSGQRAHIVGLEWASFSVGEVSREVGP